MLICREIQFNDADFWNELINKSITATFFQTQEWLELWMKHFEGNPYILGVFENDLPIGIAPLDRNGQRLEFLGTSKVLEKELVSDYGDIIAIKGKEKEVWESLFSFITKQQLEISLPFVRENSPSFSYLEKKIPTKEKTDVAPQILLPSSWDEYLVLLNRHNRHELRRKIKKMGVSKENILLSTCSQEDIVQFFTLMTGSSDEKAAFLTDPMKIFFKEVISFFYEKKCLELVFLKIEGKIIAGALLFFFGNDVLLYNSGFDTMYYQMAPGYILTALLIERAIEDKKSRFDFLRGDERYKFDLGAKPVNLYTFTNQL